MDTGKYGQNEDIFQLTCVDNPALRSLPRREN